MLEYQKVLSSMIEYVSCGGKIQIDLGRRNGKYDFDRVMAMEFDRKVAMARQQHDKENGEIYRDGIE
jgi:hypothetical protein